MNKEYEEGEIKDETTLFLRKETESNNDEDSGDEWDDSQLVKEYDRAVAKAKKEVLKKLQSEMGLTNADLKEVFGDTISTKKKKYKKADKKKTERKWDVGSMCRAIYFEDGEEYEAEILELVESDSCIVNFIGYNNHQEMSLRKLKPSLGKRAVEMQVMEANQDKAALQEMLRDEESHSYSNTEDDQNKYLKDVPIPENGYRQSTLDERLFNTPKRPRNAYLSFPPPPPPPPPPPMGRAEQSMDVEALNSMLMSWYMCGYYTGYYQRTTKDL